jgi:hypothetical protein
MRVSENDAEVNIYTWTGGSKRRLKEISLWEALYYVQLTKYYLGDEIKKDKDGKGMCHAYERINTCRILVGRHNEKIQLRRSKYRWEINVKMCLKDGIWACELDSSGTK